MEYIEDWIDQKSENLLDISNGSTVLIRFKKHYNGITIDNGHTVDISWMRIGDIVHATGGAYSIDLISAWKAI